MTVTSALIGGAVGTSMHMLNNAMRKVPISRSPWIHVGLFFVGAYAGDWYEKKEKSLLNDVNELRADKGLPPLVGTDNWFPTYMFPDEPEKPKENVSFESFQDAKEKVFEQEGWIKEMMIKSKEVDEAKTPAEKLEIMKEYSKLLEARRPEAIKKILKELDVHMDDAQIQNSFVKMQERFGPEISDRQKDLAKLQDSVSKMDKSKMKEYIDLREKMNEMKGNEARLLYIDAVTKRLNERLANSNFDQVSDPDLDAMITRLEEEREKLVEKVDNGDLGEVGEFMPMEPRTSTEFKLARFRLKEES